MIVILGLCFLLIDWLLFETGRQRSKGWNNFGRSWEENFIFCRLPETSKIEAV